MATKTNTADNEQHLRVSDANPDSHRLPLNIGMEPKQLQSSADILNRYLADVVVLYIKTRNYHWNVTGPTFRSLHKLFQEQYEELDEIMDTTAERVRQLGVFALGSMRQFEHIERIDEETAGVPHWKEMVSKLVSDHETIIRYLRENIDKCQEENNDAGNADVLTAFMEQHEKMAWMLRSFIDSE
jgi:starvation-inducible DNA-binding protein